MFLGGIFLIVRLVPYQTSHLKMLAVILMIKQMLILLTQKHSRLRKSERNKVKLDRRSDQQIQALNKVMQIEKALINDGLGVSKFSPENFAFQLFTILR